VPCFQPRQMDTSHPKPTPTNPDPPRSTLCLALGAIHRASPALPLLPAVPDSVETLFSVASRPAGAAPLWALQGLLCVAGAAGRAYAPHVKRTLQLCQELLVGGAQGRLLGNDCMSPFEICNTSTCLPTCHPPTPTFSPALPTCHPPGLLRRRHPAARRLHRAPGQRHGRRAGRRLQPRVSVLPAHQGISHGPGGAGRRRAGGGGAGGGGRGRGVCGRGDVGGSRAGACVWCVCLARVLGVT
jgi:hypothetical protein